MNVICIEFTEKLQEFTLYSKSLFLQNPEGLHVYRKMNDELKNESGRSRTYTKALSSVTPAKHCFFRKKYTSDLIVEIISIINKKQEKSQQQYTLNLDICRALFKNHNAKTLFPSSFATFKPFSNLFINVSFVSPSLITEVPILTVK